MLTQLVQRIFQGRIAPAGPLPYDSSLRAHRQARGLGYLTGRAGEPCTAPPDIRPSEHHLFCEGWGDGQEMRARHQRLDAEQGLG